MTVETTTTGLAAINGIAPLIESAEPLRVTAEDLRWSAAVAQHLTNRRVEILAAFHNGRRIVLHVDRDPNFEGLRGSMIRRQPAAGGYERIYAIQHVGVQVQWTAFEAAAREVANG
jgi:hypothetical protein